MSDLLARAAEQFGDLPFMIAGESTVTFAEADVAVRQRASEIPTGESVPIRPEIDIRSVIEIFAIVRATSQAVLVPPSWPAESEHARLPVAERVLTETIVFTSGTSGPPKAVRLDESNWAAAADASTAFYGFGPSRCWLLVLPLHHVSGLSIIYRALWSGGAALLAPRLDPALLDQADFASLVPTQLVSLLDDRHDPARTEVLVGGAFLSRELVDRASGWRLHRTYGMTETAAVIASGTSESNWMTVLPGLEVSTTDEGTLRVRGRQVSRGYVGDRERTSDDWFVTSDQGVVEDGRVSVAGRADRVIITGGEKVDPAQIETVLSGVTGVDESAAFGLPDDRWGQAVAVVYAGTATPEQLSEAITRTLGRFARPRQILRIDRVPRNELGKIDYDAVYRLFG